MEPRQLMLQIAISEIGIEEWPGKDHNPAVMKYFRQCGWSSSDFTDETAWCSAFINWVAKMSHADFSKKLNARSWLNVGEEIEEPQQGDVVIFWRGKKEGWQGHVGLYMFSDDTRIAVLGGNQSNTVNIKVYPKSRLLGYRRLSYTL